MHQKIDFNDFRNAFLSIRPENFSRDGLWLLFGHFEQLEQDTGAEMELDVIAICCDYTENTFEEITADHDIDLSDTEEDDIPQAIVDFLFENTHVVGQTDNGVVYANF